MLKQLSILFLAAGIVLFAGCPTGSSSNHDPYPLVSPTSIDAGSGDSEQTFQLESETNPDGTALYDEDGDTVTVAVDPETPLPVNIVLEASTGILTVSRTAAYSGSINFWTEDDQGGTTESAALSVGFTVTVSGNLAPYPINGPSVISPVVTPEGFGDPLKEYQLEIAEVDNQKDPDGDIVSYKSETLPSWITLDENSGVITVDTSTAHAAENFDFWTEDEHNADTSDNAFAISIEVRAS